MLRDLTSSIGAWAARATRPAASVRRNVAPRLALALTMSAFASHAWATVYSWTGVAGDNLWSTPTNWSPNGIPGAGDDVTIGTGASAVSISNANVTVATLDLQRTLSLAGGRTLTVTTASLNATGTISLGSSSTLSGGTYAISFGGNITFPGRCGFARLSGVTLNGDITGFGGGMRWNNVTLNGTITATASSEIIFEGSQTITGTIASNTNATLILSSSANGTLTIASGAKIQGGDIEFYRASPCIGGTFTYNVINNGTIDANIAGRSISFNTSTPVALTNSGVINVNGGTLTLSSFSGAAGTINLNSGALNAVSTNPINLGTFNRTTGTAAIFGTCDLGSGTWTPTGSWSLANGAVLQNGTVSLASGSLTFPARCGFGRLSNITLNGNLPAFTGGMRWNNVTLNGTITATGSSEIAFEGSQTITGTIASDSNAALILSSNASGTLTIASGAKIQGGDIDFYRSSSCLGGGATYDVINNGTIDANIVGRTINFNSSSPVSLTNNGTVNVSGGTLTTAGFSNSIGTLNLKSGTLNFNGSPQTLGNFTRTNGTGGTANLFGTNDLGGGTWTPLGAWNLSSAATLQNGSINLSGGSLAFPARCGFARLSNITLNGNLPAFTGGMRWNNVTLNGTITATGSSEIAFEGSQTITGTLASNTTASLILSSNANGTLTVASGAKIQGGDIEFYRTSPCLGGGGTYSVVNNGLIDANIAGRAINFNTSSAVALTNNGTVNINGGTLTTNGFTNPLGTLNLNSGTLNFTGSPQSLGTFTRTGGTGGTANLLGSNDLQNATWTPLGAWNLASGATLQNGTITLSTGSLAFPARCAFGRLSNITLNGNLPAFTGGLRWNNVTLNGTITATGNSEIAFEGSQTITGTIAANTNAALILGSTAAGTLTIAPGAKILGGDIQFYRASPCFGGTIAYDIVNNGTIDANIAGRSITLSTTSPISLTNNGTIAAGPGSVLLAGGTNAGTFLARAGGVFSLGNFAYTFGPTGVLDVELKGPPPTVANFGRVTLANNAASTLALGGTLRVRNVAAYTPTCGLEWEFIKSSLVAAGTPITGTFSTFDFPFAGDGNLLRVTYGPKVVSYFIATQADFNQDGFITFEDFDAFVAAFEAGDAQSDFNLDGFLTFEDFDAFVAKFEGGC